MRRAIGAIPLVAVVLLGCGGASESAKNFSGEKQKAAQVIEDFESAARDGDEKKICDDVLSKRNRPESCEADVKAFLGQGSNRKVELEVKSVQVHGNRASARVAIKNVRGPSTVTYPLAKEDGDWRITAVDR